MAFILINDSREAYICKSSCHMCIHEMTIIKPTKVLPSISGKTGEVCGIWFKDAKRGNEVFFYICTISKNKKNEKEKQHNKNSD